MNENEIVNKWTDLIEDNTSYWKFTQSIPNRSKEEHFIEYPENKIVTYEGSYPWLSFTKSCHLWRFYLYGDRISRICTSIDNPQFLQIKDTQVRCSKRVKYAIESKKIVIEKHYNLKDLDTIRLLVSTVPVNSDWKWLNYWVYDRGIEPTFEAQLKKQGLIDSANLMKQISDWHKKHKFNNRDDVLNLIDEYMK